MNEHPELRHAYRECRRLARRHYENFPVASRLVPRDQRDALAAIYAFARGADDFADEPGRGSPEERLAALAGWRAQLEACWRGEARGGLWLALADSARRFNLSREHFENLICAFETDVRQNHHPDFASLLDYCRCSANPVGRLVLELFGHREPELLELSDHICTALQLANFWQDVRIDFERDRIYLPVEDLLRFGYSFADLRAQRVDGRWRKLLAFEVARTRELFERGRGLPERVRPELRRQLRLTWLGGMTILARIEAAGYDVFHRRPSISGSDFVRLYFRARRTLGPGDGTGAANSSRPLPLRRRLTSSRLTNFYYSFIFLPRAKRRAIEAVYAFARRGDDLADGTLPREEADRALAEYRALINAFYAPEGAGGPATSDVPEFASLGDAVRRFKIPRRYFDDLAQGFELDLAMNGQAPYRTFPELERYCYCVAGTIGLIAIEIFGYRNPSARDYALNLGTALQLVNILRDLESDARRGRVYLPLEDLSHFGLTPKDIRAGRYNEAFVKLMEFECERAEQYFDAARRSLAPEDRRSMVAAEIMGAIYWRLLERIRARRYHVYGKRVRLSRWAKFWTALRVYLGADWRR